MAPGGGMNMTSGMSETVLPVLVLFSIDPWMVFQSNESKAAFKSSVKDMLMHDGVKEEDVLSIMLMLWRPGDISTADMIMNPTMEQMQSRRTSSNVLPFC